MIRGLFVFLLLFPVFLLGQHHGHVFKVEENLKSDTIDIKKYTIDLDLTDSTNKTIRGVCKVDFAGRFDDVDRINLELLKLTVDSVRIAGQKTTAWNYNDTVLSVNVPKLAKGVVQSVEVFYQGRPHGERWGGWYNTSNYQFNLGVGFESIPHNLGKVWHPCFDNFVERATYEVSLTTFGRWIGVGSGTLIKVDTLQKQPNILKRTWQLNQEIPTYLYGIASAPYVHLHDTINGKLTKVPSDLYVLANQVTRMQNKTKNLEAAYKLYEDRFGKYRWDRVGYVATSQGAMEHATNIALPFTQGSFPPETTVMHELSHHWWGDLLTCETDRDMWINEGMAVFSEYLFTEDLYGAEQMYDDMQGDLFTVLTQSHLNEGGYQPISGVPRVHTYGTHTYRKGALVAHNLRKRLGDAKCFSGFKQFIDSNAFDHVNSYDLRNQMISYTNENLNRFFDDWVFGKGMVSYALDSIGIVSNGSAYEVQVNVRQLKAGTDHFFDKMPIVIQFVDEQFQTVEQTVWVADEQSTFTFSLTQKPVYVTLNPKHEINYAMTSNQNWVKGPGSLMTNRVLFQVNAKSVKDSALVRCQTHWTGPYIPIRNAVNLSARVNNNRYWRIDGVGSAELTGTFIYNAKRGQLDYGMIEYSEDSLILLYRSTPSSPWEVYSDYTHNMGPTTDSVGSFSVSKLRFGEYTIAELDSNINESLLKGIKKAEAQTGALVVYPNPVNGRLSIELKQLKCTHLQILNYSGAVVYEQELDAQNDQFLEIDTRDWTPGVFFVLGLDTQSKAIHYQRLIKE